MNQNLIQPNDPKTRIQSLYNAATTALAELEGFLGVLKTRPEYLEVATTAAEELARIKNEVTWAHASIKKLSIPVSDKRPIIPTDTSQLFVQFERTQIAARSHYLAFLEAVQAHNGPFRGRIAWWRSEPWASVWVWLGVLVIVIGIGATVFPIIQRKLIENELKGDYDNALAAYGKQDYPTAIKFWQLTAKSDYKDSVQRLGSTYNVFIKSEFEQKNWTEARVTIGAYKADFPNDGTTAAMYLNDSYYLPAEAANSAGNCDEVLSQLANLSPPTYKSAQNYRQGCIFKSAQTFAAAQNWSQVDSVLATMSTDKLLLAEMGDPINQLQGTSYLAQANSALAKGDYAGVRKLIAPVMTSPLNAASANATAANVLLRVSYYTPAKASIDAKHWVLALPDLEALYKLDQTYSDTRSLLITAYYEAAGEALTAQQLDSAQGYFEKQRAISPDFRDGTTQLVRIYYDRAQQIMNQTVPDYSSARAALTKLLAINAGYRDSVTMWRETYYRPAAASLNDVLSKLNSATNTSPLSSQPCIDARDQFQTLLTLKDPSAPSNGLKIDYKDTSTLINETYYCEVRVALAQKDYVSARTPLLALAQRSPNFQDIDTLYNQSFYLPAKQLIADKKYSEARPLLIALLTREQFYQDAFLLLRNAYYLPASANIAAANWRNARQDLASLISIDPQFKPTSTDIDAFTLYRQSYYQPAVIAINAKQWTAAQTDLAELVKFDPAFKPTPQDMDASTLYRESYYLPATTALTAKQWDAAILAIDRLLQVDNAYKDVQTLHREVYYQSGMDALGQIPTPDYGSAQKYLGILVGIDSKYKDAYTQYENAYFLQALALKTAQQWEDARTALRAVYKKFGNYREVQTYLGDTYYLPAALTYNNGDWQGVRGLIDALRADQDVVKPFKDADTLWVNSYLTPGKAAVEQQNWTQARLNLKPLFDNSASSAQVKSLYLAAYKTPGLAAFNVGDWDTARSDFLVIHQVIDQTDSDVTGMLLDTYYLPASDALKRQDWSTARYLFSQLIGVQTGYKDADNLLHDSYMLPISAAIQNGNMAAARSLLVLFKNQYPKEQSVYQTQLLRTYSSAVQVAIVQQDWYSAADRFLEARAAAPQDKTLDALISTFPYLRQAIAARYTANWQNTALLQPHNLSTSAAVFQLAFSPDGGRLASAGAGGLITLWDMQTSKPYLVIDTATAWVYRLAFDPNGQWLAASGTDSRVQIWDTQSGQLLKALDSHTAWISALTVSPDGKTLAVGSDDMRLDLWSTANWTSAPVAIQLADRTSAVAYSPDGGTLLAALANGQIVSINTTTQTVTPLAQSQFFVKQLVFTPDSKSFLTLGNSNTISIWSVSGQLISQVQGNNDWLQSADLSADGSRLVIIGTDRSLIFWDLTTNKRLAMESLTGIPTVIRFSFDSSTLVVADDRGVITFWQASASKSSVPVATPTPMPTATK